MASDDTLVIDTRRLAGRVLLFCVAAEIAFVVLDYQVNYGRATGIGGIRRLFNIAREDGLASWFGTAQTLLAALTLWLIHALAGGGRGSRRQRLGWLTLALFFSYMAVDDGAQLHERLGSAYDALKGSAPSAFPSYTWQLLLLPVFGLMGVFVLWFLWQELGWSGGRLLVMTALACLAFAVALDFVEGLDADHRWNLYRWIADAPGLEQWCRQRFGRSADAAVSHFAKSLEETAEMLANTLLWYVFLRHLEPAGAGVSLRLGGRAEG